MGAFFDFGRRPGNLYVVATLLPLLSFLILLLWNAVRAYIRKLYDPERENTAAVLYRLLDGSGKSKVGAYIATAAIGSSFVLVLIGYILFSLDQTASSPLIPADASLEEVEQLRHSHWNGSLSWAWLTIGDRPGQLHVNDASRGTMLQIGYHIDHLSGIMFLMVTLIATLIHLFSIGYMSEELHTPVEDHEVHVEGGHLRRRGRFTTFFMYLSLFCFSMLNLILANNLFQIFVSWELVGICSFLLIGYYFERRSASNAANKAFITNRIGDAGFIIGLLILWTFVGSLNFDDIFRTLRVPTEDSHAEKVHSVYAGRFARALPTEKAGIVKVADPDAPITLDTHVVLMPTHLREHVHAEELDADLQPGQELPVSKDRTEDEYGTLPYWMLVLAGLGIFLGCVGKSAQFPLHVWLPDAMEGPTPVSALIHAATMVAAGVYLVGRAYPLFTPEVLLVIAYVGAITLFVAATIAIVMTDIKKVLAYSTVSQLGYMMLALGIGGWVAGLFHLVTHAFFKALLFLCSGSVIYGCHHVQEMTRMGGLLPKMRITALTMLVGVLTISGLPLLSGWYSKDAIIAQAFGFGVVYPGHFLLTVLPVVTAGITTFYMFRMWFMTFTGKPRDEHVYEHAKESPWVMTVPLIVLAFFSITVAWGWPIWDARASWLGSQLHASQYEAVEVEFGVEHHDGAHGHGEAHDAAHHAEASHAPNVTHAAHAMHDVGGIVALLMVIFGFAFAAAIYWRGYFDPAEAKEKFITLWRFLWHKWHFDELYSVMLVRPALVMAGWCRTFDLYVIDGALHATSRATVWLSWLGGLCDRYVVDGVVNLIATVSQGLGARLRGVQTGYLRSYVLFLVLAAIGIWMLVALATGAFSSIPR